MKTKIDIEIKTVAIITTYSLSPKIGVLAVKKLVGELPELVSLPEDLPELPIVHRFEGDELS